MEEELVLLSATDLKQALRSNSEFYGSDRAEANVSAVPAEYFDEGPYGPVGFEWAGEGLLVTLSHYTRWPENGDEDDATAAIRALLSPLLARSRSTLRSVEISGWTSPPDLLFEIEIEVPTRSKTVREIFDVGAAALRLCEAFSDGSVERDTVADLIRGGGADLLEGQPEGHWLEAKVQEYDIRTTRGAISLAQSVARFCNAEHGGLIVVGAATKKVPGGEVIQKVRGVTAAPGRAARYQQVINDRLYPPPFAMRIDQVAVTNERSLLVIDIPPQPEELKPFLVHGAILSDGSTEGAFISIVQRRGEGSIPITAPMIHATLAAGRALLRGTAKED